MQRINRRTLQGAAVSKGAQPLGNCCLIFVAERTSLTNLSAACQGISKISFPQQGRGIWNDDAGKRIWNDDASKRHLLGACEHSNLQNCHRVVISEGFAVV